MNEVTAPASNDAELVSACAAASQDLTRLVRETEDAAHAWGMRPTHSEWRFLSAMLGTVTWLGKLVQAATSDLRKTIAASKEASEAEVRKLRVAVAAAELQLQQTQAVESRIQVDQDLFISRFVETVTPDLVRGLGQAIVLREKRLHRRTEMIRCAIAAGAVLAVFLGGYVCRAAQDEAGLSGFRRCVDQKRQEPSDGEWVCPLSTLAPPRG